MFVTTFKKKKKTLSVVIRKNGWGQGLDEWWFLWMLAFSSAWLFCSFLVISIMNHKRGSDSGVALYSLNRRQFFGFGTGLFHAVLLSTGPSGRRCWGTRRFKASSISLCPQRTSGGHRKNMEIRNVKCLMHDKIK